MQKKVSLALSIMLLTGLTNSVNATNGWSATKKAVTVAGICCIIGAGRYVEGMNKEYANNRKDPDWQLAVAKTGAAAGLLIGTDMLLNDHNTAENLVKIGAFTVALAAGTDTVAHAVKHIPSVGAILTGPIVDGKEVKETGAAARIVMAYVPLRQMGLEALKTVGLGSKVEKSN